MTQKFNFFVKNMSQFQKMKKHTKFANVHNEAKYPRNMKRNSNILKHKIRIFQKPQKQSKQKNIRQNRKI